MDLGPLRALALNLNFSVHGVDATVTRPYPDNDPITTRGIWVLPQTADVSGTPRRDVVHTFALRRADVPTVPRGTIILAAERFGAAVARWRVEGPERIEADHVRVIVVPDPNPY